MSDSPFEVVGELTYDPATDTLRPPAGRHVTFTEGWIGDPSPSTRTRRLNPTEALCIGEGWSQVPLNDPIRPERVVRALLTIFGTRHNLDAHDAAVTQLCWYHTRNGDGS
jgi:hypothetical protein